MSAVILGGSFNPVHIGHLVLIDEAIEALGAEKAYLIPASKPPHKDKPAGASDEDRLAMLALAVRGDPRIRVLDCEIARGGVSYTVDTLEWLASEGLSAERPHLLIGDDLAPGFGSWREPDRIASLARLTLAHRASSVFPDFPWPHERLENSLIQVSSSMLRDRAAMGLSIRYLVPGSVFEYIRSHGLYRNSAERGA